MQVSIFSLGDSAMTLSFGDEIRRDLHQRVVAAEHWLRAQPIPGVLDIVTAYASVTIIYDVVQLHRAVMPELPAAYVEGLLRKAADSEPVNLAGSGPLKKIPVCYEAGYAPDLHHVSTATSVAIPDIVKLHTSQVYDVYMIGFLPGFPYLATVPQAIQVPRKKTPARQVRAGSVGLAGMQTGIYPSASPGGWQIIGCTPLKVFDPARPVPPLIEAGDRVQFYAIDEKEFKNIAAG